MWLTSSDIELVTDVDAPTAGVQKVGLRFTTLAIPVGAVITNAYLTFRAVAADPGMTNSDVTNLTIKAHLSSNAPAFTTTASDISNRTLTTASAAWAPATWTTGTDYTSPSIASVIQEIVDQGTWAGGNAIAVIITGTGHRASQAYDTNAATAANLTVTYAPITYYSKGSLAVSAASSWNSRRDGTGTDAAGFTGNDTFVVQSGHAMTLSGSTAWSVGAGGTVQIENGGTWTNTSSGAVTIGTLQVDDGGTYAHGTAAAFPGTTRTLGATSTVNWSGAAQTVAALSYGHLTISNAGTKTLAGTITPRGNLTVSGGTFDLGAFTANRATAGGTLTVGSGATLKIGGTNGFPSSYASEAIDVASTIEYGGTSQAVRATSYGNLTFSGSGTKTFAASTTTLGGALTIGGGLTVDATTNGSTIDYSRNGAAQTIVAMSYFNLTVSGARAASNVTLASSGTIGVAGTFAPSATFTTGNWVVTGSTVRLNGSTPQAITAGFTFNNLTLANSSGVTLGANCTVNGVLTLTSGNVTTGASTLAIGAGGSVSRASGHVVGNLQKNAATGATSRTFEIGTGASYTPVTVAFANVSVAGNLVASTAAGDHASIATAAINPSRTVNRTWTLTNGGVTFTTYGATFTFVAGDLDGGATTGNFVVGKYAASTWTYPTVGTRTATSTQVTGLASFSDFQIGEPSSISGTVFEDLNYGGGAGRSKAAAAGVGRSGARVELYTSAGVYSTFTTTDANGDYSFPGLVAGTYHVRVVNGSVTSSRTGYTAAAVPVQTYRTTAATGAAVAVTDFVGGTNPAAADPGNGSAGATFNTTTFVYSAGPSGTAQSVAPVVVSSANVPGVDFGFSFNAVVNTNDAGQGSLRQFIDNANLLGGDAGLAQAGLVAAKDNAVFMISNGTAAAGLRAANTSFAGGVATISPTSALATISTPMVLDAQKQPGWTGAPLVELNGTNAGALQNGFTVSGGATVIRGLIVNRFTYHGIYLLTAGGNTVQGNWVGLDSTGSAPRANAGHGISVFNSPSNLIGGTSATERNVVSGNTSYGVAIDGASATGNTVSGNYVGLNAAGTAAVANTIGIDVEGGATGTTVGGTTAAARNVVSGNSQMGVLLQFAGTSGNTVAGNYVGLDAAGAAAVPNGTHGVIVKSGATGNTVGGTTGTSGNVVSGNAGPGIVIQHAGSSGNVVAGNLVGLNPAGTAAIANASYGVRLIDAPNSTIGGTVPEARNVISGNAADGLYVLGVGATGNLVQGNYIGTNAAGTAAVANTGAGVWVEAASNNTIGGTAAGARNVISGNTGHGIFLYSTTTGTVVQGNLIGANAAGTAAVGNQVHGIAISGTGNNTIGGTTTAARNVISGNVICGVRLAGGTTSGNVIQGNFIGVDVGGTAPLGNGSVGVLVDAVNTSVGGTADGAGNVIAHNGADGVAVVNASSGAGIWRNAIYANAGLGIDLANDDVTANDGAKTGGQPNLLMDFPVIGAALLSGTTLTVTGYVGSAAGQSTFAGARVEIFKSDSDASGNGEGQAYLGFLTADSSGNLAGSITVSGLSVGDRITATATDPSNDTSEFGANLIVAAPVPTMILVGSVAPSGSQPPGTDLTFTTTFTNVGTDAARGVVITRPVPANTDLKLGSVTQALGTTGLTVVVTYSSDGGASWSYTPASGAGGAPAGYDHLATHVRWTFTGDLSQVAPGNTGSTGATVRIR